MSPNSKNKAKYQEEHGHTTDRGGATTDREGVTDRESVAYESHREAPPRQKGKS